MGVVVTLSESELMLGAQIGVQRQIEALLAGRPDRHGFNGADGWSVHVEGACGELAVAKVLDRYWAGTLNTFKSGGDVGALQVRTRSKAHYDLLIRSDDRDEDLFILVTGRAPTYTVVGYIRGAEGKKPEYLQTHGNRPAAYFVPQAALTRFEPVVR